MTGVQTCALPISRRPERELEALTEKTKGTENADGVAAAVIATLSVACQGTEVGYVLYTVAGDMSPSTGPDTCESSVPVQVTSKRR